MISAPQSNSACTNRGKSYLCNNVIASRNTSSLDSGKSSIPEWIIKALHPNTPACNKASRFESSCGTTPPQKPISTNNWSPNDCIFISKASAVVVTGSQFNGMSMTVVIPPAIAAWVAVKNPSHSVLPGSLMCTWLSTKPAITTSPVQSTTSPSK